MSVFSECCVLSGRGLCVGLITRPEQSYRLWCVSECYCEASIMWIPWPTSGCCAMGAAGWGCVSLFMKPTLPINISEYWCVCFTGGRSPPGRMVWALHSFM
jgi:hypothetical protein